MKERFTKGMARNIYYGGSLFFILAFIGLTVDTHQRMHETDNSQELTEIVAYGKKVWEDNNCVGCHTLLGEGAYFAPELGNVYERYGNSTEAIKAFIKYRPPAGIPGRRSMPQFNLDEEELEGISQFLKYVNGIKTHDWPPNIQG